MKSTALSIVKSREFIILVVVLIILFVVWKNWAHIKGLFRRDVTDYTDDPSLTEADKRRLDELAQALFGEFDGITTSTEFFEQLPMLNDRELRYLAERYKHYSGGEPLSEAIADELIAGDSDARMISRLNAMNL